MMLRDTLIMDLRHSAQTYFHTDKKFTSFGKKNIIRCRRLMFAIDMHHSILCKRNQRIRKYGFFFVGISRMKYLLVVLLIRIRKKRKYQSTFHSVNTKIPINFHIYKGIIPDLLMLSANQHTLTLHLNYFRLVYLMKTFTKQLQMREDYSTTKKKLLKFKNSVVSMLDFLRFE